MLDVVRRCSGLSPSPVLRSLGEAGWEKVPDLATPKRSFSFAKARGRMRALYVRSSNVRRIVSHTAFRSVKTSTLPTRHRPPLLFQKPRPPFIMANLALCPVRGSINFDNQLMRPASEVSEVRPYR